MAEKPILFSGEMVKAILDGRKTQTRRVIKPQPDHVYDDWMGGHECWTNGPCAFCDTSGKDDGEPFKKPYEVGDILWVRETWKAEELPDGTPEGEPGTDGIRYRADNAFIEFENSEAAANKWMSVYSVSEKWCPSIHMPKWAARIWLEIEHVRVERVKDISKKDAIAEGIDWSEAFPEGYFYPGSTRGHGGASLAFAELWDTINAKRGFGWDRNPWVWVIEFKKTEAPR